MQFSNPFDNPQGQFYILRNDQQQYSPWPAHCDLPAGCTVVSPPPPPPASPPRPPATPTPGWRPTGQP